MQSTASLIFRLQTSSRVAQYYEVCITPTRDYGDCAVCFSFDCARKTTQRTFTNMYLCLFSSGTHFKAATCNIEREIEKVRLKYDATKLFPTNLVLQGGYSKVKGRSTPSGGWGDARDIQLCKLIAQGASGVNLTAILNKEDHRWKMTVLSFEICLCDSTAFMWKLKWDLDSII